MNKKIIIGLMLLTALLVVSCSGNKNNETSGAATYELAGNDYIIPADQITDQMQIFEYDAKGTTVRFIVVRGSDGEIRTAYNACDVCGGAKGYRQEGHDIVCNNCGKSFQINGLGTQNKGYGCWPSFLSHKEENGNIVLDTAELEVGAYRFA